MTRSTNINRSMAIVSSSAFAGGVPSVRAPDIRATELTIVFDGSAKEIRLIDRVTGNLISRRALGGISEYKLYSVAGSPSTVDLLPHGVATASTIVTLSAGGYSRTVTMTRGGHVRVSP